MNILRVVCIFALWCCCGVCFADEAVPRSHPEVSLDLSLYPKSNDLNLPTLGTDGPTKARVSIKVWARTLKNGYNFSSDTNAPVFVRVSPHSISIRLEWKFK